MNKQIEKQIKYFDRKYSGVKNISIKPWQNSYILRIKENFNLDKKNFKLLDIASGTGYVAVNLANEYPGLKVYAIDISPQSLKLIRKQKKSLGLNNLEINNSFAEKINLKSNSIDYIVANAILEHVENEDRAIREWKRILKSGGKIMVTVPIKLRYVWPFFWPINVIHDKRLGHLRRYDVPVLQQKFAMETVCVYYTGHLMKFIGVALNLLLKSDKFAGILENIDNYFRNISYGSSNLVMVFKK